MKESKFKNKLSATEVHSVIDKLKDKEPTPAWIREFKCVLDHYCVTIRKLGQLASESNKVNVIGRRYGPTALSNIINHYTGKINGFTKNGQKTINDHLDVLAEYLIDPDSNLPEEHPIPTLRERLEKERAEGKWERVTEAMANKAKEVFNRANEVANETGKSLLEATCYCQNDVDVTNDVANCCRCRAHVKRIKKHKKHKKNNIYITINIGR